MLHSNWPWRIAAWNQAAYDRSGRGSHTSAGYRMSVQPQDLLGFTTFYGCLRLFKSPSFFIDSHMLKIDKRELKIAWLVRATRDWNRKPLAKIFLEMTSVSLIFCHSLCGSIFFSFPTFIHHLCLRKPLPAFNRQAVSCHNKSDQFSSSALQNQRKSSPDTKQTHKTNPASQKWNPTRCCFSFTATAIFFTIALLLPVIFHWCLLLVSFICQQISLTC